MRLRLFLISWFVCFALVSSGPTRPLLDPELVCDSQDREANGLLTAARFLSAYINRFGQRSNDREQGNRLTSRVRDQVRKELEEQFRDLFANDERNTLLPQDIRDEIASLVENFRENSSNNGDNRDPKLQDIEEEFRHDCPSCEDSLCSICTMEKCFSILEEIVDFDARLDVRNKIDFLEEEDVSDS